MGIGMYLVRVPLWKITAAMQVFIRNNWDSKRTTNDYNGRATENTKNCLPVDGL
jgi:hypothetical protein